MVSLHAAGGYSEKQGGWLLVTTGSQHVLPVSFWQQIWGAARPQGIGLGLWGFVG